MNSLSFFIFNTYGVIILFLSVILYEFLVVKKKEVGLHVAFSAFAALLITVLLKELYSTTRPFILMHLETQDAGLMLFSSFPSAHTSISFALATTVTLHQKRFGVLVFMLASLMSISRVLAYAHYPIDIIFGIMVGVIVGIFFDSIHFAKKRKKP